MPAWIANKLMALLWVHSAERACGSPVAQDSAGGVGLLAGFCFGSRNDLRRKRNPAGRRAMTPFIIGHHRAASSVVMCPRYALFGLVARLRLPLPTFGGTAPDRAGRPHGTRGATPHPKDDVTVAGVCCWSMLPRRQRSQPPSHEARDLNLPVEPGVRQGRDALVRSTMLLQELLP
jgi:hypothetical protein